MRSILILIFSAGLALCQSAISPSQADEVRFFSAAGEIALSNSPIAFTVQAPVKNTQRAYLRGANVYCSVACTITQEKNGTAATSTALTPVPLNSTASPTVSFFIASNVGGGTAISKYDIAAGQTISIDLSYSVFSKDFATAQNYTIRTNSITGTVRASFIWGEK